MYPQMKISNICKIEDIELMTGRQNMGRGLVRQALLNTFSKGLIGSVSQTSNQARFHNTIRIFIIKHTNQHHNTLQMFGSQLGCEQLYTQILSEAMSCKTIRDSLSEFSECLTRVQHLYYVYIPMCTRRKHKLKISKT